MSHGRLFVVNGFIYQSTHLPRIDLIHTPTTPIPLYLPPTHPQTILQNTPNVGQVTVTRTTGTDYVSWAVTFQEAANVPLFSVHSSNIYCGASVSGGATA